MSLPLWPFLTLPWVAIALFAAFRMRLPPELPRARARPASDRLVSVVIPARNEERNIRRVVESVGRSTWPRFEIVVVDDRSTDGTADVARVADTGRAERVEVVAGEPLPEGWLGKPWACRQGAARARGDLILFTDADTVHGPALMARAVAALDEEESDAVSVIGRQLMESFWERLVQPQIFMAMAFRYPDLSRPLPRERWRGAIANGQYILFRADAYDALGGHDVVRDEVVEDLRLAQILVRDGWRFRLLRAEDDFATRMYTSLSELVSGWSKNVVLGGLQTLPPWTRWAMPPVMLLTGVVLWLVPPVMLAAGLAGLAAGLPATEAVFPAAAAGAERAFAVAAGGGVTGWAAAVVAVSAVFWCAVTARFRAPWWYGLLYPLGALAGSWIVLKSWVGMRTVRWKGRTYSAELPAE